MAQARGCHRVPVQAMRFNSACALLAGDGRLQDLQGVTVAGTPCRCHDSRFSHTAFGTAHASSPSPPPSKFLLSQIHYAALSQPSEEAPPSTKVPHIVMTTGPGDKAYYSGWSLACDDHTSAEGKVFSTGTSATASENPYFGTVAVTPGSLCNVTLTYGRGGTNAEGSWWLGMGQAFTLTETGGDTFFFVVPAATPAASELPATEGVATSVDEIRGALNAVGPGNRVELFIAEGATIDLDGAPVEVVGQQLRLFSEGRGATLSARGLSRLFWVADGGALELSHLTLIDGSANFGGAVAVLNDSIAILEACDVFNCTAAVGGGFFLFKGRLTTHRSTLRACMSAYGGGTFAEDSWIRLHNTTISGAFVNYTFFHVPSEQDPSILALTRGLSCALQVAVRPTASPLRCLQRAGGWPTGAEGSQRFPESQGG